MARDDWEDDYESTPEWDDDNDTASEASSSDEDEAELEYEEEIDATVHSVIIYSRSQLWSTTSSSERAYLRSRPGICAGLSLAWLQLIVRDDIEPANCWPEVSFARQLQEYIEHNSVRHHYFPEVAYMSDEGRSVFYDVDDGLQHVWHNPGSYILLIRPLHARIGHAVAYSDKYSYPNGYLMNPNKGSNCCYTFQGLADQFRSDRFITRAEDSSYGPEFIIIRIGKPSGSEHGVWHAYEHAEDNDDQEYIQYGA